LLLCDLQLDAPGILRQCLVLCYLNNALSDIIIAPELHNP
jgi:hypothetical protein